ncbi:MAG TPA: Mpo1-like protein [Gammaproteobacteria bacterium]|nr:Mpo1-like protein [Gammaproteobacteria bacterium]
MRAVQSWLDEYGESHQNPINKTVHWICVPLILLSLIGLLWSIPMPHTLEETSPLLNWGILFLIAALLYYFALAWRLALGMTLVVLMVIAIVYGVSRLPASLWLVSLSVFVIAWIGQFIGHKVEGRKPSFFRDVQFLLIGPLWLLAFIYRGLHIAY